MASITLQGFTFQGAVVKHGVHSAAYEVCVSVGWELLSRRFPNTTTYASPRLQTAVLSFIVHPLLTSPTPLLFVQSLSYDRCESAVYRKALREKYVNAQVCLYRILSYVENGTEKEICQCSDVSLS